MRWVTNFPFQLAVAALAVAGFSTPAVAYRPFDGTDADVAAEGEFELELGPAQFLSQPDGHYVLAPATVLNFGVARAIELVVDFKQFVGVDRAPRQSRVRLLDTDVFVKAILKRGTLQGDTGLSIAIEGGPLTPELGGKNGFGALANLITSYRWPAVTLHLNTSGALSREHNFDGFASLIAEGPRDWVVRPVSEVYVEAEVNAGTSYSGLAGAIWQLSDAVAIDAGVRGASYPEGRAFELRFGLTWALAMWHAKGE